MQAPSVRSELPTQDELEVVLVPHTHWDREWYLPFEGFLERLIEMMDGLIDVLDRDPRFAHFHLDGQVALIDDYLDVRPEREQDVRRLAVQGRLSMGPWYTQMDEFLVSGESHVRNLERGLARARDLRGSVDPVDGPAFGYLPDQFGHIGQMPQILRRAGIGHAVVWRGVPAAVGRTPFWWEAPDGSRVLTEYLAFGYSIGAYLAWHHDAEGIAGALRSALDAVAPFSARARVLITVGSDHTVAQAELGPLLPDINRLAGVRAAFGSISSYVNGPAPEGVPTWRGELRSAARAHLLPNVYSSRIHQKRERARVEALVERYAEPLAALVPGLPWPAAALDRTWRLLLWNGAHDSVCGCGVDEVARAVDGRHAEARSLAQEVVDGALARLAAMVDGPAGATLRFNPSPFERDGVPGLGWTTEPAQQSADDVIRPTVDGHRLVADLAGGGVLDIRLVDEGDVGDLYTFCPAPDAPPSGPGRLTVDDDGTALASFDDLTVRLRLVQRAGEPFVRVEGVIDNERSDHRLRLHVALPRLAEGAVAASPFELVSRPLVSEGSDLEAPSPTWPARGAVLAGGLAVLAEGVVEYEVAGGMELAVTLLRCVGSISHGDLATRPAHAGPDFPTPDGQMLGRTSFLLAVLPSATPQELLPAWERLALPLAAVSLPGGGSDLPGSGTLLEVMGAELSAIRRVGDGGDGIEVRVWNPELEERMARVAGRTVALGAAGIETIMLPAAR